jgi:hypothetical protein
VANLARITATAFLVAGMSIFHSGCFAFSGNFSVVSGIFMSKNPLARIDSFQTLVPQIIIFACATLLLLGNFSVVHSIFRPENPVAEISYFQEVSYSYE